MLKTKEEILDIVNSVGLTQNAVFDAEKLSFRTEVRDMCAADKCNMYGKNWACPPACGTLDEIRDKASEYSWGIVVQKTGQMEDPYDVDVMMETEQELKKEFTKLCDILIEREKIDCFPMGAGSCMRCSECTYPDAPCRFPDKLFPSMEACGLVVSDTCELARIPYYYGKNTITYTCCILFKGSSS